MVANILNWLSTAIMTLVFSVIVDSQLELKPAIVSLILKKAFIKRMMALGKGMVTLGIAQSGVVQATSALRTVLGYACEDIGDGDLVRIDQFGGFGVARGENNE